MLLPAVSIPSLFETSRISCRITVLFGVKESLQAASGPGNDRREPDSSSTENDSQRVALAYRFVVVYLLLTKRMNAKKMVISISATVNSFLCPCSKKFFHKRRPSTPAIFLRKSVQT